MNKKLTKNLLESFSCILGKSGKKISGHKLLLECLFVVRENTDLQAFLKDKFEKSKDSLPQDTTNFNFSDQQAEFQNKVKDIKEFLNLLFYLSFQNKKLVSSHQKPKPALVTIRNFKTDPNLKQVQKDKNKGDNQMFGTKNLQNRSLCVLTVENVKPVLETRKIRKGRVTYQVPLVTSSQRQVLKAISLLIENANLQKKNQTKRPGSFLGDNDSFFQKIGKIENKNRLTREQMAEQTLLFGSQISMMSNFGNPSPNKNFLILPSRDQSFKKTNNGVASSPLANGKTITNNFLKSKQSDSKVVDRNSFFMSPEKKLFLSSLRKPNLKYCLSEQFIDSIIGKGESIEKKKQLHKLALQNRAYLHFRWW